jgi:hypothetical protein
MRLRWSGSQHSAKITTKQKTVLATSRRYTDTYRAFTQHVYHIGYQSSYIWWQQRLLSLFLTSLCERSCEEGSLWAAVIYCTHTHYHMLLERIQAQRPRRCKTKTWKNPVNNLYLLLFYMSPTFIFLPLTQLYLVSHPGTNQDPALASETNQQWDARCYVAGMNEPKLTTGEKQAKAE